MNVDRVNPVATMPERSRPAVPKDLHQSNRRDGSVTSSDPGPSEAAQLNWKFLTNHSHVLVLLSRNPSLVLREVALHVGITERAVQRIISDLEAGGIIEREKIGRKNYYRICCDKPLRHGIQSHRTVGELLALLSTAEQQFQ